MLLEKRNAIKAVLREEIFDFEFGGRDERDCYRGSGITFLS